jgi:hypothetical protein
MGREGRSADVRCGSLSSLPVYWSGPPTRADVLRLALVLKTRFSAAKFREVISIEWNHLHAPCPPGWLLVDLLRFAPRCLKGRKKDVDGRDKPGHDGKMVRRERNASTLTATEGTPVTIPF